MKKLFQTSFLWASLMAIPMSVNALDTVKTVAVPEPSVLVLLGLGLLMLSIVKRKK